MKKLDHYEYLEILKELDYKHGSFYHLWEMGKPRFVKGEEIQKIRTSAVTFNKNGHFLEFLINEDFWNTLNLHQKAFVIAHECLHVTYNHGYRLFRHAKTQTEMILINYACDIVINHRLLELGFERNIVDPDNKYCWIDTVFSHRLNEILPNRSSEYYYVKLKEEQNELLEKLKEILETVDQHTTEKSDENGSNSKDLELDPEDFQDMTDILKELSDRMTPEEMNEVAKDYEKRHEELDQKINDDISSIGGTNPGTILKKIDISQIVRPKDKWETVIKKWVKKTKLEEFKREEQWARTARRFQLLSNSSLMLPNEMETCELLVEKNRIGIYFFLDTSGSCSGLADRFWKAAKSIPTKYFDVRMFCFDTQVYETTIDSGKLYGGGGTAFQPIEQKILEIMKAEKVKYPEAVFIITDGYGNRVNPRHPERWHWFMTPNYSKTYVPRGSHVHKLEDFE